MPVYSTKHGAVNAGASTNTPPTPDEPIDPVIAILGSGRVVAHRVDLALAVGSTTAGLLLSQFWFWTRTPTSQERDGWFYLTIKEISEQTGLSYEEQKTARKRLVSLGIVEEQKAGNPMKIWYHVKEQELVTLLREYAAAVGLPQAEHAGKPQVEPEGKPQVQPKGFPYVGKPSAKPTAMPQDKVGLSRRIARGKAQGLVEGIPNDITKISSETSSPISLSSPLPEGTDPSHKCDPQGDGDPEESAESPTLADHLWAEALAELGTIVNKPTMQTHLVVLSPVSLDEPTDDDAPTILTLSAASEFSRGWVEKKHRGQIEEITSRLTGSPVTLHLITRPLAAEGVSAHV